MRWWYALICAMSLHKGVGTSTPHTYRCPRCGSEWAVVVW